MRYVLIVVSSVFFSSCAALPHLDEALTLKDYSDDKDAQVNYVTEQDRKFEALLEVVRGGGSLTEYHNQSAFLDRFGDPVLRQTFQSADGQHEERWLYRYSTRYFDGPKVYVWFDEAGRLKRVEHDGRQR